MNCVSEHFAIDSADWKPMLWHKKTNRGFEPESLIRLTSKLAKNSITASERTQWIIWTCIFGNNCLFCLFTTTVTNVHHLFIVNTNLPFQAFRSTKHHNAIKVNLGLVYLALDPPSGTQPAATCLLCVLFIAVIFLVIERSAMWFRPAAGGLNFVEAHLHCLHCLHWVCQS